jgi:periplasmic protein TonB
MSAPTQGRPEAFTLRDIGRAAGVRTADVQALVETTDVPTIDGRYLSLEDAAQVVHTLGLPAYATARRRRLFAPPQRPSGAPTMPVAASGALHAGLLAAIVLIAGLGVKTATTEQRVSDPVRLVFLATPGPGGGGGGGGLREPRPAPRARLKGETRLKSPVTVTPRPVRPEPAKRVETPPPPVPVPAPKPDPPPPVPPAPTPPVVAPVVSSPADTEDRAGVATEPQASAPSQGQGTGGGSGTGNGTGMGEGNGAGIGDGSIAGFGGGPYRPGSGITPPTLQREVKPVYTDDGRRRGIQGDVVMEVVVRADGTIGAVKILQGLGAGLDQRAVDAVRQWKFLPARRQGTPVDVLVEIAVEFRLR